MQATLKPGSRTIHVAGLPGNHPHGLDEINVSVGYVGDGGHRQGIALDHDIIPAIVTALNTNKPEAQAAIDKRKAAAAKWATEFNAPALEFRGTNPVLKSKPKKALGVIVLTEHVRDYLAEFDPMALKQAQEALNGKSYIDYLTS